MSAAIARTWALEEPLFGSTSGGWTCDVCVRRVTTVGPFIAAPIPPVEAARRHNEACHPRRLYFSKLATIANAAANMPGRILVDRIDPDPDELTVTFPSSARPEYRCQRDPACRWGGHSVACHNANRRETES